MITTAKRDDIIIAANRQKINRLSVSNFISLGSLNKSFDFKRKKTAIENKIDTAMTNKIDNAVMPAELAINIKKSTTFEYKFISDL